MHVDQLFSINNPDGYLDSAATVGRISVYMCPICGCYVGQTHLSVHTEIHNKEEERQWQSDD